MIARVLSQLRLVEAEPPSVSEISGDIAISDRLIASAMPEYTWTVIREHWFGGRRMLSLRWRNALILREESALRSGKEGWRRA